MSSAPRRRLAVIVPAHNTARSLGACIEAIRAQTRAPDEIIVFDDGSTDTTAAIARRENVRILTNPGAPKGPALARNAGARVATAEILAFVDADVVLDKDALAILETELLSDQSISAVFGSYNRAPQAKRIAGLYANLRHHYIHQNGAREAATFWTGLGAVRTEAFDAIGGFDERIGAPAMEDVELGARLRAAGGRIRIAPEAQGSHCKDWSLGQLWLTDIFSRAIPWARLVASGRSESGHLNASPREAIAAAVAHLVWVLAVGAFFKAELALAALAALSLYIWLNRRLFAIFAEAGGARLAVAGGALHWFYHLYASAIFGVATVIARFRSLNPAAPARIKVDDVPEQRRA
jgi:glycosyltransferase involved in cell wall biosynthesis